MESERILRVFNSTQIALNTIRQPDARFGWSMGQNRGNLGKLYKCVENRRCIVGTEQNVKIANCLCPAAETAANFGPDDLGMVAHRRQDWGDESQGIAL